MSNMFSGSFELEIGEIYALRTWTVKPNRTRGLGLFPRHVATTHPWESGVNHAVCRAGEFRTVRHIKDPTGAGRIATNIDVVLTNTFGKPHYQISWADGSHSVVDSIEYIEYVGVEEHDVPAEACSCGFYAYSAPEHWVDGQSGLGRMSGIMTFGEMIIGGAVKATGRTLIGTKGIRTQKAEIVALLRPFWNERIAARNRDYEEDLLLKGLAQNYPGVPFYDTPDQLLEAVPLDRREFQPPSFMDRYFRRL